MGQPGMRITVDAAMRARDVSRPGPDGAEPAAGDPDTRRESAKAADPPRRTRAAKNERRRQGKRGARNPPANGL
ncbi:hypothetical protein E1200_16280 [Actinomadura sp. GC306]|uniref:hypothetical protein n=1 Tax=Actinomadura sp. GC306 TaxID=2530367 RepID=UPI00104AE945|nr:hypothetical protein [Actinomadura sp. GC306]TDC66734.1 hypothetical protein E1200_16280 [Actinomadura sp. GC306]